MNLDSSLHRYGTAVDVEIDVGKNWFLPGTFAYAAVPPALHDSVFGMYLRVTAIPSAAYLLSARHRKIQIALVAPSSKPHLTREKKWAWEVVPVRWQHWFKLDYSNVWPLHCSAALRAWALGQAAPLKILST